MALFPGYVFVNLNLRDRLRVLRAPGAVQFVTFQGQPAVIPDSEIRALESSLSAGLRLQPHPYLHQGARVRLKRGPLVGAEGIMIRRKERFRLVLSIDLIMRSVVFEVDEADVEPTEVHPLDLDPELLCELQSNLMLFFTGSAHHSWTILQEQEKATHSHTGPTLDALHQVRALADRMLGSLQAGDLSLFGALLDEGWRAKKRISGKISNPRIDHLYEVARHSGAVGGKI